MPQDHEPYPAGCPACSDSAGWPYAAGTCDRPEVIVVKLKCRACGHTWTMETSKEQRLLDSAADRHYRARVIPFEGGARKYL
jgi:hypothetical protein